MFNLTVYCRRTLNTIPPESCSEDVASFHEPAARIPIRFRARVFSCLESFVGCTA